MTDVTELEAIRSSIIARYKEAVAAPKPSYNVNGQSVSWNEYRSSLLADLKEINAAIAEMSGPLFETTQLFSGNG